MRIAFLGNFQSEWSTENDLAWTMEKMGHKVVRLQESDPEFNYLISGDDLFFWVHTHGWDRPWISDALAMAIRSHVPTVMFHLDRFWGLNELDDRENQIGKHPMWACDYCFTADGGNDARFKVAGVNHYWSPPAIAERWCYRGTYTPELACDIAFVGSESYHPEYPFRGELIRWLRETYGERFRLIQDVRGPRLNDLYASVKVCVGDSCFAGADRYWSDRVPETMGRGGLLLHPLSEGMDFASYAVYAERVDLKWAIDHFLNIPPEVRETVISEGQKSVIDRHTYTHRLEKIFETVFGAASPSGR